MKKKAYRIILVLTLITCFNFIIFARSAGFVNAVSTRKITWSGYDWTVRTTNQALQGPGPNLFNDSESNVWLDENNFLHLKITNDTNNWYCAEIFSDLSFGYGKYIFKLSPGYTDLDVNVVVGLFTYLDDQHEIDIEFTRWGDAAAKNSQYVCQPYYISGNQHRFTTEGSSQNASHAFTWCEDYIKFHSEYGNTFEGTESTLIEEWFYTGESIPEPSTERVHLNLWLFQGNVPTNEQECEVIIQEFQFLPSDCNDEIPNDNIGGFNIIIIIIIIITIMFIAIMRIDGGSLQEKN